MVRILLVDDDEAVRAPLARALALDGHSVTEASDGAHALETFTEDETGFDLMVSDIRMPVMDGITALKLLREREAGTERRTRVLMVTAHAMTGDRERFLSAGADGYVSKPMSQSILQQEIERVLYQSDEGHVGAEED